MPKIVRYPIEVAMGWELYKESLNWAITDRAENDLGVHNEEGEIVITVDGADFVATFTPAAAEAVAS